MVKPHERPQSPVKPRKRSRVSTQKGELGGRLTVRSFSSDARWRFVTDRRRRFLARISGEPTDYQASLIEDMIDEAWNAKRAQAEGTLAGCEQARRHRDLYNRLLKAFQDTLRPAPAPRPRRPTLREIVAEANHE
jgi:hypothetical protein